MNCRCAIAGHADAQVADAANGEARTGEVRLGKGDVGQGQLQVAGILDLLRFERLAVERADRNRHFLQRLVLALRSDDDDIAAQPRIVEIGEILIRVLCLSRKRNCTRADTREQGSPYPH